MIEMLARALQIILVIWFVTITLFILVPSYTVLKGIGSEDAKNLPKPPEPPAAPTIPGSFDPNLKPEIQQELLKTYVSVEKRPATFGERPLGKCIQ
jgi:hypothetical protein